MSNRALVTAALVSAAVIGAGEAAAADAPPIKALLITGGVAHDYAGQQKLLPEALSARAAIDWTIESGEKSGGALLERLKKPDWAKGFDIVVHNHCYSAVKDKEYVEGFVKAHQDGVPGMVIHGSLHSFRSMDSMTDAWRLFLGVTSVRHERGGRQLTIKTAKADHPIMMGTPAEWKEEKGELYVIEKLWPQCTPLATAYGEDTKKDQPVMWINTCGKGRVFGCSLGHANTTFQNEACVDTLARGFLWACDKLDDQGKPKPGYGPRK
jgi:type 1 glutamine amidotransferase